MILSELRTAVRDQLQLDESELPNTTVDFFLRAAFDLSVQAERNWPSFEKQWDLATVAGSRTVTLDDDFRAPRAVFHAEVGRLNQLDHEFALENFHSLENEGLPDWFSIFGGVLYLWPNVESAASTLTVIGWRAPTAFPTAAGGTPDCDERMHIALVWYACSLAKSQEEDEVLAAEYQKRWQETLAAARADIMRPDDRLRALSGGARAARANLVRWST